MDFDYFSASWAFRHFVVAILKERKFVSLFGGRSAAMEVTEGLYSGGWGAARPKVSDSTYAEGRFKFFLGATKE